MKYETEFAGKPLKIETNSLASQSSGSVLVSFGNTVVLGTATMGESDIEADFLPLTVDYEERFYASGKIKGSRYVRREGRPSEVAVLAARMIDRAIRPYFPGNLRREVQVILTVFAFDEENDPDFPALLAASLSLLISNIPCQNAIAGVRVGVKNGDDNDNSNKDNKSSNPVKFVLNPVYKERENAKLDLFISGIQDQDNSILFNMLDGEAEEMSEKDILSAIDFSEKGIKELLLLQKEIQKKEGKEKVVLKEDTEGLDKIYKKYYNEIKEKFLLGKAKGGKKKTSLALADLQEKLELNAFSFERLTERVLHEMALKENLRADGRKFDELRKIDCKVGMLKQTHGSGLFFRGLTHVLSIITLGAPGDELLLEGMEIVGKKRFLHHYNFPPYSVGEVRFLRGPGRREIGHGVLAEKALRPVIPDTEKFPYTIRIVSEILSSNGSSSMASVCASSLALFDAGIPVKRDVSGISVGLMITDEKKPVSERQYKILTDIQGPEDSLGDMDFKVAGTEIGITALQLDVKVKGLTFQILKEGFSKAKKARFEILGKMKEVLPNSRPELSSLAPRILTIRVHPDKIREIIGPSGKVINAIIEKTGASIDIEEDGLVFVTGDKQEMAEKAIEQIRNIVKDIEVGEVFDGRIEKIMDFGLFVNLSANKDGLLHVSEIPPDLKFPKSAGISKAGMHGRRFRGDLNSLFEVGQFIKVKVKNISEDGKISLAYYKK